MLFIFAYAEFGWVVRVVGVMLAIAHKIIIIINHGGVNGEKTYLKQC